LKLTDVELALRFVRELLGKLWNYLKKTTLINLIFSGTNAPRGGYPWLAALGYKTPQIRYLCGGTLITQKHVISAAHCILDSLTLVRLGAWDITSSNEGAIDVNIETKVAHESYDPKFITNDISMLKLSSIVNITNLIKPICIPLTDPLINKDFTGSTPFVVSSFKFSQMVF
jgi:serine protease 56